MAEDEDEDLYDEEFDFVDDDDEVDEEEDVADEASADDSDLADEPARAPARERERARGDAEEGDDGLHGEHADEHEHDVVGFFQHLRWIDALAEGVGGISDELLEVVGKRQRKDGGEEQRGERGKENQLFPHEVAENPSVG